MKAGDKVVCPYCNEETFLKNEAVLDGWTKVGDILNCALCGKKIADVKIESESESESEQEDDGGNGALSSFAGLLGGEELEDVRFESDGSEKVFCRDCRHYISHPFMDRCSLHEKNVNPMDDCNDFQAKNEDSD